MKTRIKFTHILALALLSSFILSACGIRGELKTPPPLWGDKTDTAEKPVEKPVEKLKSNK